ncbi:hypothetical protein Tco_0490152 [Tanacetum coccineum]
MASSEYSSSRTPLLHEMTTVTKSVQDSAKPFSINTICTTFEDLTGICCFYQCFDETLNVDLTLANPNVIAPIPEALHLNHAVSTGSPFLNTSWIKKPPFTNVGNLFLPPDKAFVISLKWIYKVNLDELGGSVDPTPVQSVEKGNQANSGTILCR